MAGPMRARLSPGSVRDGTYECCFSADFLPCLNAKYPRRADGDPGSC